MNHTLCRMTLLAALALAVPILAQQDENRTTGYILYQPAKGYLGRDWLNGRWWRQLEDQSKIMFVTGVEDGLMLMARESAEGRAESSASRLSSNVDSLTVKGFKMSDIVRQIDDLYRDTSNLRVPIADMYKIALKKMHGTPPKDLDEDLARLRRIYNQ